MNYIIFKADGSVDKQNFDYYVNQGNVGSQFFVGFPTVALHTAVAVPTLPNGESSNTFQGSLESSYEYADGETSDGWLFTIPSACTTYNGLLRIAIYIANSSNVVVVSYPIGLIINETGVKPDTDTGITIEEINSYLVYLSSLPTMADLSGKVDKLTTSGQYVYAHLGSTQGELPVSTPATGGSIPKRESDGRLKVATPSSDSDATTKKYVDDSVSPKANDDEVVHIAGTETITGEKTFSRSIYANDGVYTKGLTVSSDDSNYIVSLNTDDYPYFYLINGSTPLGTILFPTISGGVTETLATEDYVATQIASAISNVYKIQAPKTVAELNALTLDSSMVGYVYNVTTSGTLNAGNVDVVAGDNVVVVESGGSYIFDKLAATVDLSGYVQTSRTIAGISLSTDISVSSLYNALFDVTEVSIDED